jgi:Flp pilus assembly protein TadG
LIGPNTANPRLDRPGAAFCRELYRNEDGVVAIVFALTLVVLLGFVSLGTEVVLVLLKQRQMQAAASDAALASAAAVSSGNTAGLAVEAQAIAASAGFVNGVGGAVVTVNTPPASGPYTGSNSAVEVIVSQPQTLAIASLFGQASWPVSGRAVATVGSGGDICVLALDSGNGTAVPISGGATVNLNKCGLAVSGTGAEGLKVSGSGTLNAEVVNIKLPAGGYSTSGNGAINATNGIKNDQSVQDPYQSIPVPSGSGCKYGSSGSPLSIGKSSGVTTLSPDGVYCGGLEIRTGASVFLNPGVYIFKGGQISTAANSTLTGVGVTLVLTGSLSDYTNVDIGNNSTVNLSAPSTGTTAGLLLFQDKANTTVGSYTFGNNATAILTGALYFPTQTVDFKSGFNLTSSCTQLVAWRVIFSGGVSFNSNCSGVGVAAIGGSSSKLVE